MCRLPSGSRWRNRPHRKRSELSCASRSRKLLSDGQAMMDGERKRDDDDRLARQRDNDRRMEEELGTKI